MGKAIGAGAKVVATRDPEGFLPLYAAASANHWMRYPDVLVRSLASARVARFFDVRLDAECVAADPSTPTTWRWARCSPPRSVPRSRP